jgi:hypothetical protein
MKADQFINKFKEKGFLKYQKIKSIKDVEHLMTTYALHFFVEKIKEYNLDDFKNVERNILQKMIDTISSRIEDLHVELNEYKNHSKCLKKKILEYEGKIDENWNFKLILQSLYKKSVTDFFEIIKEIDFQDNVMFKK